MAESIPIDIKMQRELLNISKPIKTKGAPKGAFNH